MKFTEMPYQRPDVAALKAAMEDAAAKIANASGAQEQIDAFEAYTAESVQWNTLQSLSYVRNTVNTKDEFYAAEREYFDTVGPELQEVAQKIDAALLDSPFRKELEAHYGTLLFKNMEISRRSFKSELIPLMQEESKLEMQYQKLYAGMTVEFDGQTMPLPMLGKYKESADRAVRRAAFEAEGKVFDAHQAELDEIYDKLVKVRNAQGRLLGYDNYIQLGYDLPKSWMRKIGLKSAYVYVNAQNLFTATNFWDGYDPEVGYDGDASGDFDLVKLGSANNYPQVKLVTIGLDLKF